MTPEDHLLNERLAKLFSERHYTEKVFKQPEGQLKHPYLVPDGPYHELYDWDAYFMGVALSYKDPTLLAGSVKNFLDNVSHDGYTPRTIGPSNFLYLPEMSKPFLAQAALLVSSQNKDVAWLKDYYPKLAGTIRFWETSRMAPNGLFRWFNAFESGVDNNPAVNSVPAETTEGVDLQCYIYREYLAMSIIAERLGSLEDARSYALKAKNLRERIQKILWSDRDGMYLNFDLTTNALVRVRTWTNFLPMWARIATKEEADIMVRRYLTDPKEFKSSFGVRTLSLKEPLYDAKAGYWRGPVWVVSDFLIMHGFLNYGYTSEAKDLARKTVKRLIDDIDSSGDMNECYNPETGLPVANGHFLSWNLLAEHMLQEAATGFDPTAFPERK